MQYRKIAMLACVLAVASGAAFAGLNSKEVGSVLVFPTYQAYASPNVDTYIQITNAGDTRRRAHIEVVGGTQCDDCNFDLVLTPFQTRRLLFNREVVGGIASTVIYDASEHSETGDVPILHACPEEEGFVTVTVEDPNAIPRRTLGENIFYGDEVIVDLNDGTSSQLGAIAVQAIGANDGDRCLEFNNSEYSAFPSIVTANYWAPNEDPNGVPPAVEPELILFNVNFDTGTPVILGIPFVLTQCALNYTDAEENVFSRNLNFGCYLRRDLRVIAPGILEDILGDAVGFLWAQCSRGTHGAIVTDLEDTTSNYAYPNDAQHGDTLFQSITSYPGAELCITRALQSDPDPNQNNP